MLLILGVAVPAAIGTGLATASAELPLSANSIDRFVGGVLTPRLGKDVGSGSVVVVQGDRVIYLRSFGLARPERHIEATPDRTVYQVGSNSKLFVATAAMQLLEQGELDLDADINGYLRDLHVDGRDAPITMEQLLTHTSGIQDRKLGRAQALSDGPLMSLGVFFNKYPPRRVVAGGTEINYSGNAMSLAAHVIEAISHESFDQYAERHIFQPLAMTSASFRQPLPPELLARRAAMRDVPPLIEYPEGGLAMTVSDMGRFLLAQLNGGAVDGRSVLRPETVALMHAHHFPADSSVPGIAYGFFEAQLQGHRALVHSGDYQHQSILCLVPDARLGFFLVVNPLDELREPLLTTFVTGFAKAIFPAQAMLTTRPPARVSEEDARRYVGTYRDHAIPQSTIERFYVGLLFGEGDAQVTYDRDAAALSFQPPDSPPLRLVPVSPDRFRTVDDDPGAEIVFRGNGERAEGLYASAGALGAYSFARIPWVLSQPVQLALLFGMFFVFGVWLLYAAGRWLRSLTRRGRERLPLSAIERNMVASATACTVSAVGGVVVWCVIAQFTPALPMITGIPVFFYVLPVAFTAACLLAPWVAFTAARSWPARAFDARVRALHTAVAIASVSFVAFCAYWRLLGIRV